MNSEELEVSLRTEFESYLKGVFAETRREISQLQEKIEDELAKHKAQLDEVFKEVLSRVDDGREVDQGFKDSVVEHMRLARDEGARITATAIAEAEEMAKANAPKVGIKELYEAVNDISGKASQAEILKTLVHHAGQFTPRGAFFIIKNEYFVGWRTFGEEKGNSEDSVREVFLSVSSNSILSEAARSLAAVESSSGTYSDDADVLGKLGFEGSPDKMYAMPLVVRGRAVAVLYTDYGTKGNEVNVEALETMVRVASLTVEVLASAKGVPAPRDAKKKPVKSFADESFGSVEPEAKESAQPEYAATPSYNSSVEPAYKPSFESESFTQEPAFQKESDNSYNSFEEYSAPETREAIPAYTHEEAPVQQQEPYQTYQDSSWNEAPVETVTEINADDYLPHEPVSNEYSKPTEAKTEEYSNGFSFQPTVEPSVQTQTDFAIPSPANDYQFEQNQGFETQKMDSFEPVNTNPAETYTPPVAEHSFAPVSEEKFESVNGKPEASFAEPIETQSTAQTAAPARSRFSERNVDLPIEVSEDERRLHNDARRFARLLVSEIKLYNEQKVKEGREAGDLYERLREAIDRSREMYDKRIQPPVAAKFDYFNYELVNTLAEGDESRLGNNYPGASV